MMDRYRAGAIIAVFALVLLFAGTPIQAGDQPHWDGKSAGRYLDARAAEWAKFGGANRGKGADKVSCVSCHTMLSYAFGRPAARHLDGEDRQTAQEDRMLEHIRRRVANWKELDTPRFQLSYDFDERKKVESWGTESVLNALILSLNDRRVGLRSPSDSTRDALRNLWGRQQADGPDTGSWDWLDFGLRPWEASEARYYGATLAAIAVGSAPGYLGAKPDEKVLAGVERLRTYFRGHFEKQNLHNLIWTLWASTLIDGILTGVERDRIIEQVLAKQQDNGGWSLFDARRLQAAGQDAAGDRAGRIRDRPGLARPPARRSLQAASWHQARVGLAAQPSARVRGLGRTLPQQAPRPGLARRQVHDGRLDGVRPACPRSSLIGFGVSSSLSR